MILNIQESYDFFLDDIRPQGWNHWAEVVHKDYRANKYIGDMPHTWVGSEYINAIRTMFVYEDFSDTTLYIGAGIDPAWFTEQEEISFSDLCSIPEFLISVFIFSSNLFSFS